jgi:cytochrome c553
MKKSMSNMTRLIGIGTVAGCLAALWIAMPLWGEQAAADGPQYTSNGQLKRPADYREWIFLSSGLGMTYGPTAMQMPMDNPDFDNVFVNRTAYKSFQATGTWPDKTIFILEVRASQSKGSINKGGHFQAEVTDMEAHVKDEKRFPGKWAFFGLPNGADAGKQIAKTASCYSCHEQHGTVDTTFVQFYPTLIEIAKAKGTYN